MLLFIESPLSSTFLCFENLPFCSFCFPVKIFLMQESDKTGGGSCFVSYRRPPLSPSDLPQLSAGKTKGLRDKQPGLFCWLSGTEDVPREESQSAPAFRQIGCQIRVQTSVWDIQVRHSQGQRTLFLCSCLPHCLCSAS